MVSRSVMTLSESSTCPPQDTGVAAHKQADTQPVEGRGAGDEAGKAPRLVRGQGVHRVDDERLDAASPACRARAQWSSSGDKAFRLAAASAGGDQGVRRHPITRQPLPRLALVRVGGRSVWKPPKKSRPALSYPGRAGPPAGTALHPGRFVIDEAAHDAMEEAIGRLKAGDQELLMPC